MFNVGALVGGTLLLIAIIIVISCIKIVHQAQALVVERLGAGSGFCTTAGNHKR